MKYKKRTKWYMYTPDKEIYKLHTVPKKRSSSFQGVYYIFPVVCSLKRGREALGFSGAVLGKDFEKYWRPLNKIEEALYL